MRGRRRQFPRAARHGPEDRLVLRPGRESRAVRASTCRRRARARCLQLCSALGLCSALRARRGRGRPASIRRRPALDVGVRRRADANGVDVELAARAMPSMRSRRCIAERRRFDVVVLDPPAFIKRKKDHPKGQAAYRRSTSSRCSCSTATGCWCPARAPITWRRTSCVDAIQRAARHLDRFAQVLESAASRRTIRCIRRFPKRATCKASFCCVTR